MFRFLLRNETSVRTTTGCHMFRASLDLKQNEVAAHVTETLPNAVLLRGQMKQCYSNVI